MKRRLEKEKKNVLYGAADEILLEETKQYKVISPTRSLSIIVSKLLLLFSIMLGFQTVRYVLKKLNYSIILRKASSWEFNIR